MLADLKVQGHLETIIKFKIATLYSLTIHTYDVYLKWNFVFHAIRYCSMVTCYFLNPQSFCPASRKITTNKNNKIEITTLKMTK